MILLPIHAMHTNKFLNRIQNRKLIGNCRIKRVYIIGPSKISSLVGIVLSGVSAFATPMGEVQVCQEAIRELKSNRQGLRFLDGDIDFEEEEYFAEINLPFLQKVISGRFEIIPIYLGIMDVEQEILLATVIEDHFNREDTLFVFCSNLCRWGNKYCFTPHAEEEGEIFLQIEKIDKELMKSIEKQNQKDFENYTKQQKLNLDGRAALSLMLSVNIELLLEYRTL